MYHILLWNTDWILAKKKKTSGTQRPWRIEIYFMLGGPEECNLSRSEPGAQTQGLSYTFVLPYLCILAVVASGARGKSGMALGPGLGPLGPLLDWFATSEHRFSL